jgi:hypothetical protein
MLETAASGGWKAKDAIEWFHGIGRLGGGRSWLAQRRLLSIRVEEGRSTPTPGALYAFV